MKIWVHIDGRQLGPYAPEQLPLEEMDASTPVWYNGLPRWTPAGEAPATAQYFLPAAGSPSPEVPDAETVNAEEETIIEEQTVTADIAPAETAPNPDPAPSPVPGPEVRRHSYRPPVETEKCPPTYLVWSILLTLCCCNPLGIIPIITGAQVSSRYNNMDFEGARRASNTTEWWVIICLVLGLMMLPFNILIYL